MATQGAVMSGMKDLLGDDLFSYADRKPHPTVGTRAIDDVPEQVRELFERLSLDVFNRGFHHYSADAVLHRIRWHFHIERGESDFKCNDHWTAVLSRWFMKRHPEVGKFFETRRAASDNDD